jgi:hypothetical protein
VQQTHPSTEAAACGRWGTSPGAVQVVARRGLRCDIHDFLIKNSPKRAVISVGHLASGRVRGKAAHRRHRSARVPPSGSSRRAADPTQSTTNHIPLQEEQRATNIRRWPTWRAPLAYEGKLTSKASDCEQKPQIGGRPTAVGFVPEYGTWHPKVCPWSADSVGRPRSHSRL